jgi:hypothetical protein
MAGLVRLTNGLVGGLNGYNNKEGGLPYHMSGGSIALSGLFTTISVFDKSVIKAGGLGGALLAGPIVMGIIFGMGHLTGEAIRYTKDSISDSSSNKN